MMTNAVTLGLFHEVVRLPTCCGIEERRGRYGSKVPPSVGRSEPRGHRQIPGRKIDAGGKRELPGSHLLRRCP